MTKPAFISALNPRHAALLAGAVAWLFAAGCGRQASGPAAASDGHVLAVVDGRALTDADVRLGWGDRPAADSPAARAALLDQLIQRSALAGAARRAGLDREPELAAELDRLLIARLRAVQLQPRLDRIAISEADVAAEYERGRATRYHKPEQVRAAVLWFETRGQEPLADRYRPRLEAARAAVLQAGAALPATNGFGALAVSHSEHRVSRYRGGDVGWLTAAPSQDAWNAEVLRLAAPLREPGDLSEVSATPAGLFLVRLIAREPGGEQPYAAVRDQIRRTLLGERRRRVEEQFNQEILQAAHVARPSDAAARLAALPLSAPTPGGAVVAPTPAYP